MVILNSASGRRGSTMCVPYMTRIHFYEEKKYYNQLLAHTHSLSAIQNTKKGRIYFVGKYRQKEKGIVTFT
jgi:hypothetical protein